MTAASRPPRPRRRLFWRVYLYGVALLVMVVLAAMATAFIFDSKFPASEITRRTSRLVAKDLARNYERPGLLRARLQDLQYVLDADVAVYRGDGKLVAAAGEAPAALSAERARGLAEHTMIHDSGRRGMTLAVVLEGQAGAYVIIGHRRGHGGLYKLATMLGILLALLALAAIPLARTITRPLERITDTAAALGRGDLSARTGLDRADELGHLARVLDQMAARLDHTMRAEKELWANISHELRTPLSRIRVALELCEEEEDGRRVTERLAGIAEDIAELDRLIGDVLMTARLDLSDQGDNGGGFVLRREPTDLSALAEDAARRAGELHGLDVAVDAEDLPSVEADPALVRRVLNNLLDNAAKYSAPEAGVTIRLLREDAAAAVEVLDRGLGVPEDDLPRLFDHFFRADRSRSRGTGGLGLGLTLCRRIVEAHGGTIEAENREGGGLRVRVRLPAST